jgi:syntaxin-binding protein 1
MFGIGSTHTITPRQFIDDLKVLELAGTGSRAIPNGLREGRVEQRSYQEYYDERYFTKDAPPPPKPEPPTLPVPDKRKLIRISPANSFASSVDSTTTAKEEKKKKKGGLFRF